MVLPRTTVPAAYAALIASWVMPGKRAPRPMNAERAVWVCMSPMARTAAAASTAPSGAPVSSGNWRARAAPARSSQEQVMSAPHGAAGAAVGLGDDLGYHGEGDLARPLASQVVSRRHVQPGHVDALGDELVEESRGTAPTGHHRDVGGLRG